MRGEKRRPMVREQDPDSSSEESAVSRDLAPPVGAPS